MNSCIILLLLLSFSSQRHTHHLITDLTLQSFSEGIVDAKMGYQSREIIDLLVGDPFQPLHMKLSIAICGIWIFDKAVFSHGYESGASRTAFDMNQKGKVDYVEGNLYKDQMSFLGIHANEKIPFLLVSRIKKSMNQIVEEDYDGLLGFGYQCNAQTEGNINLIQLFMKEEVRPHDLFAYQIDTDSGKGVFTLANYPKKLNTMNRHYRTILLNKANTNGHWEVKLHSVYFDNDDIS